ncbi:MAG: hypothetical protein R3F29_03390 [Planctomycetota bacterium]
MNDRPLQRDYSRRELERRFVLSRLPDAVDPTAFTRLRDLFVADAQLRLRIVEAPDGRVLVVKLGQKRADPEAPDDARCRRLTTIYMSEAEARALAALPGRRSCKRRYHLVENGLTWAIDVWEEPSARVGLVMAEVECGTLAQLAAVPMPSWAEREVGDDPRFSAFALAE